jgi:hypothetical protein
MQISAHDYKQWMDQKQKEYSDPSKIVNPVDAIMIAQISPGEVNGIYNSLDYAHDLVKKWLPLYKFAAWRETETRKVAVTKQYKEERALEIAENLSNHTMWRSHGRSLKISDLENIGLKINNLDSDPTKADVLYKINTLLRLIYLNSNIYKMFITEESKLFEAANVSKLTQGSPDTPIPTGVEVAVKCESCGSEHEFYVPISEDKSNAEHKKNLPDSDDFACSNCSNKIDLKPIKAHIAQITGKEL